MEGSSTRHNALMKVVVFGIIPCILGAGTGQYLRWSSTVWLTDTGGVWPVVCIGTSAIALLILAGASPVDKVTYVIAWLIVTWTWLYFPLWLAAIFVPQSSAVVRKDGRVFVASEWAKHPADKVWLLTGQADNKIVRNVVGSITVNGVEVKFRFADPYIATRGGEEDLSKLVISAVDAALMIEAGKSRSSRIALFEKGEVHDRLLDRICRTFAQGEIACPLRLTLTPLLAAGTVGGVWSKSYTEQEAIEEKHLPTLVQLLTHDNSRLVDPDLVYALFMELVSTAGDLATVARKSRMLNDQQYDAVIKRVLMDPMGANDAVNILVEANRLTLDQRQALRTKAFREASIGHIVKHVVPLRITDAEVALIALRMRSVPEANPEVAVSALEIFGERLPQEIQQHAVRTIIDARASHALAALRHLNFSNSLRDALVQKVVADASIDDFDHAKLSREKLEAILTPTELRPLIASVVRKSESSEKWLSFAVRIVPIRAMTIDERKTLINELMFANAKSALEFVSENRHFLEASDVSEVTTYYSKTISRDMCLHLTHRNTNRRIDYFSEAQLQIFNECAQAK